MRVQVSQSSRIEGWEMWWWTQWMRVSMNTLIRRSTTTGRCSSLASRVESRFALRRGSDLPPLNTTSCSIWCRSSWVQLGYHWISWDMITNGIDHFGHVEVPFVHSLTLEPSSCDWSLVSYWSPWSSDPWGLSGFEYDFDHILDFLESRTENIVFPCRGRFWLAPCDACMQGKLEQHRWQ